MTHRLTVEAGPIPRHPRRPSKTTQLTDSRLRTCELDNKVGHHVATRSLTRCTGELTSQASRYGVALHGRSRCVGRYASKRLAKPLARVCRLRPTHLSPRRPAKVSAFSKKVLPAPTRTLIVPRRSHVRSAAGKLVALLLNPHLSAHEGWLKLICPDRLVKYHPPVPRGDLIVTRYAEV